VMLWLFLVSVLVVQVSSFSVCDSCVDELNYLLEGKSFSLPDQDLAASGYKLTLTSITCGEINIPYIEVEASLSHVTLQVSNAGANCTADYSYKKTTFPYFPYGSGEVNADASSSSAQFDVTFAYNSLDIPYGISVDSCAADFVFDVTFSGSIVNDFLSTVTDLAKGYIESTAGKIFCQQLAQILNINGAKLIEKAVGMSGVFSEH
jgi:hypothetical protein